MKNMILSIVAILISTLAIILVCSEKDDLKIDFTVVVGVLSILVTFLVGWNIYSVIDFKEKIKNTEDNFNVKINRLDSKFEEQNHLINKNARDAMDGALFLLNLQSSSVHMQENTYNPDIALLYITNCIELLRNINTEIVKKRFFDDANSIIDSCYNNLNISNINLFLSELKTHSTIDNRMADLIVKIEKKKIENKQP